MTVYAITDTKKGRTGIAPTYLQTTPICYINEQGEGRGGEEFTLPQCSLAVDATGCRPTIFDTSNTSFRYSACRCD